MPTRATWLACLTLTLIILLAAWVRWTSLADGLWIDELHTAWIVAGNVDEVAPRAMIGNQSPLVYWPFWLWVQAAGLNEYTLRAPFFISSLLMVAIVFGMVWSWTRSLVGAATAAILVSLHNNTIYYGVEARIYGAVQLAGICHLLLFIQLLYHPTWWRRVLWVVLGGLLLHLHYFAGLLFVVEGLSYIVIALTERQRRPVYSWLSLGFDFFCSLLLLAPVMPHIAAIAGRRKNWSLAIAGQSNPLTILFILPIVQVALVPSLLSGLFAKGADSAEEDSPYKTPPRWLIWICVIWMFVPPTAIWVASFLNLAQAFHVRYAIVSLVAPMVLAGLLIGSAPRLWQQCAMALCTVIMPMAFNDDWRYPTFAGTAAVARNEPWGESVQVLNPLLKDNTKPVFVYSGFIECESLSDDNSDPALLRDFCYCPVRSCYWLQCEDERIHPLRYLQPGKLTTANAALILQHGGGWFLLRETPSESFQAAVEKSLKSRGFAGKMHWKQWGQKVMPILELTFEPSTNDKS